VSINRAEGKIATVVVSAAVVAFAALSIAASRIGATAVVVKGKVGVTSAGETQRRRVRVGTGFSEGDRVRTEAKSMVEIVFDTGHTVALGEKSNVLIQAMSKTREGGSRSIFGLSVGSMKSLVQRLRSKDSRFEIHTKSAVVKVKGTPPFYVEAKEDGSTDVDLTPGKRGKVCIDGANRQVCLNPGYRTTVDQGGDPVEPFAISADRLDALNRALSFSLERKRGADAQTSALINHLTRKLSVPTVSLSGYNNSYENLENQYDLGQGLQGDNSGSTTDPYVSGSITINTTH